MPNQTPQTRAHQSTPRGGVPGALLRALRPTQWAKNLLLAVPLLAAHKAGQTPRQIALALAFAAFCLTASAIYIVNDLLDRDSDRRHPAKRFRPFAAGELSLATGLLAIVLLSSTALALSVAAHLPPRFIALLVLYAVLSVAYSMILKRLLLMDVLVLAGLYTLRLLAGGAAVGIPISPWLLAFAMFFFLSLAFAKRYAEMRAVQDSGAGAAPGRGYQVADLGVMAQAGLASGYLAVLVLAQYINTDVARGLYQRPVYLWGVCFLLLYWITRVWFLVHRGSLDDDPLSFALTDSLSYLVAAMTVVVFLLAGPHP